MKDGSEMRALACMVAAWIAASAHVGCTTHTRLPPADEAASASQATGKAQPPPGDEPPGSEAAGFRKACIAGDAGRCVDLGIRYGKGEGVPEDFRRGALYFARACDADHPVGCLLLGLQHQIGLGVEKDAKKAVSLFEKACSGSPRKQAAAGCLALGNAYLDGRGVSRDLEQAAIHIEKSCSFGSAAGCTRWGQKHEADDDYRRAASYFEKACDGGDPGGCGRLGLLYATGKGVFEDKERAETLLRRSCDTGNKSGCEALRDLQASNRTSSRPVVAGQPNAPLTCQRCTPQCSYEADSVRASNPGRAKALAERACGSDCDPDTGLLMWCHGQGLLLERMPENHN